MALGWGVGGHKANDGGCSLAIMVLVRKASQDMKLTRSLIMVYNGNMEMVVKG